jgi:hypothetical protein
MAMPMRLLVLIFATFVFSMSSVRADTGARILLVQCSPAADSILVQPFILWNGNLVHDAVTLQKPELQPQQSVGDATYYSVGTGFGVLDQECASNLRRTTLHMQGKQLHVEESFGTQSNKFSIDFDNGIGSAWDVSGPLYKLESLEPGVWQSCVARERPDIPWVCRSFSKDPVLPPLPRAPSVR